MILIKEDWAHEYIERILYSLQIDFPIVLGNIKIGNQKETDLIHNKDEFYQTYSKNINHPSCTEIFIMNNAGKIIEI